MKKFASLLTAGVLSMVLFAGVAGAHVTVQPKATTQGAYEVFTVRVPTEGDAPTVKVEVKIPEEVNITRFEPKPDWSYELTKDSTGKITSVVWTATGNGLSSTEFGEFKMNGKVADDAAQISWKAYQTYQDGTVVEWVGAEGSDHPASVTTVNAKPAGADSDSHGDTSAAAPADGRTTQSNLSLYISIAALAFGILAFVISLRRKAK
ncbi:YcnI family protein [Paenibacillus thermotolerans]|uniref:YcnI family copper-binding membrane protein n=1 Tax=Paenibacillus thermotolerans TaxID=3027807 RepID=UPI00236844B1|nr:MULTISPECIES: YcnI family protein [unclassified Paenibacillus]